MLNKWVGMGRITAPLDLKVTNNGVNVLAFTIAVERDYKGPDGQRQTDFIDCVAFRQTAEFIKSYFDKGSMICVEGALNKRMYTTQNGEKRYVTEVIVDKAFFTGESKKTAQTATTGGFEPATDDDGDLPF